MKFDANVNITLEVDETDWQDFLEQYMEEDEDGNYVLDGDEEDYVDEFVESNIDGEEILTYAGRAWICSVDDASILER